MDINPTKDKRYKRLKHSDDIFIKCDDILQDQRDNGNIFHAIAKDFGDQYIGWSTKNYRFANCHRAVYRLKK